MAKKIEKEIEATETVIPDKTESQIRYNDLLQLYEKLKAEGINSISDLEVKIARAEKDL